MSVNKKEDNKTESVVELLRASSDTESFDEDEDIECNSQDVGDGKVLLIAIFAIVVLWIIVIIALTIVGSKTKALDELDPAVSAEYTGESDEVTYKVGDVEYTLAQLSSGVSEPTLATKIVQHKDGNCDYSDVYITFSDTVDSVTERNLNGQETIVLPRREASSNASE